MKKSITFIGLLLIGLVLVSGCINETKYVCPDGTTVSDSSLCVIEDTTEQKAKTSSSIDYEAELKERINDNVAEYSTFKVTLVKISGDSLIVSGGSVETTYKHYSDMVDAMTITRNYLEENNLQINDFTFRSTDPSVYKEYKLENIDYETMNKFVNLELSYSDWVNMIEVVE